MEPIYYPLLDNEKKLLEIFGSEFVRKSKDDSLKTNEALEANDHLAEVLYGKTIAELLKQRNITKLNDRYFELLNKYVNEELVNFNSSNIGVIVVRPENVGLLNKYKELIESKELDIIFQKITKINFEQYWILYHHGLIEYDARYDFPSRTFNYIDNDIIVLVIGRKEATNGLDDLSSYLNSIKGKQGKFTPNTFRGHIAFNGLKRFISSNNGFLKEYNLIFDPIGMYRKIVRNEIETDNAHLIADIPIMFYSAQAIHIPDKTEIARDLSVLCTEQEIGKIKQKILK